MQMLQQFTQSHLCVVVLDQDTHNPIARMPIYAEVSIVSEVPRYQLTDQDLGPVGTREISRDPILDPILRSTIVRLIDEAVFLRLGDARARFIDVIMAALSEVKGLKDRPESEIRLLVENAVLKAMELLNIPRSEPQSNSSVSAFPLGFLATDHAGYASFDLTHVPKVVSMGQRCNMHSSCIRWAKKRHAMTLWNNDGSPARRYLPSWRLRSLSLRRT